MKKQNILILLSAGVLLTVWLLWHAHTPMENLGADPQTNAALSETGTAHAPVSPPLAQTNGGPNDAAKDPLAPKMAQAKKTAGMRGILSAYNDVPIDFYGKLEDQFGLPVANAEIKGSIKVINGVRQGTDWLTIISDVNGLFQFHSKGQEIGMMPSKKGYALASTETLFKYSQMEEHPFVSDANAPTVIKMWKLQGAEPLLSINLHYKLPYTGGPINFDLITGKIVPEGGDISVTVSRPLGIISVRNPQDWSLKIEVKNGGLIESSEQEAVTYAAPDNGYQASKSFSMSTSKSNWYQAIHQGFFVTSRYGQIYGKLGLSFHINSEPSELMDISFGGVINTNNSRNLEGDPNLIRAPN